MTKAFTVPIVGAAAASVGFAASFEKGMSNVKAITQATGDEMAVMKDKALELGASTAFSASEVAEGMANLGSAGFTTSEIIDSMGGMLDLAAASGTDLATASEIAASTLRGFGLEASESSRVADVFAKAAAETNAGVEDMGEAMKYVAPVANAMGISLEETAAAIGILSDAGIKGGQAGTTLRASLSRLAKPSKESADIMKEMGFNAYDSEGKMKSLSEIVEGLKKSTEGMTEAEKQKTIATIFGQEAMSGMMVLLEGGSEKLDKVTGGLEDCEGAASDMAKTMMDNTAGAWEEFTGALETLAISIGDRLIPALKEVIDFLTGMVEGFSNLDPGVQNFILGFLGILAIVGPVLLIVGKLMGAISGISLGFTALQPVLATLGGAFAAINWPIVLIVAAITALVLYIKHLWDTNEEFRNAIIEIWNNIKEGVGNAVEGIVTFFTETLPEAWNSLMEFFAGIPDWFAELWNSITTGISDAWEGIKTYLSETMTNISTSISEAWEGIKTYLVETVTGIVNGIKEWFDQLPYMIGFAIGAAYQTIVDWGTNLITWATVDLPVIINGIIDWFKQLPGNIWNALVEAFNKVVTWGTNMLAKGVEIGSTFINNLKSFFTQLPGIIWGAAVEGYNRVVTWGSNMWAKAKEIGSNFISAIVSFFTQLPGKIGTLITNAYNKVVTWGSNMKSKAQQIASDFVTSLINRIKSLPTDVWNLIKSVVSKIDSLKQSFKDAGKALIQSMWDGLKGVWTSVSSWFSEKLAWVSDWLSKIKSGISDGKKSVNGSHAGGLDYVPFDGYVAQLHKGERVLTKQENKDFDNSSGVGGGNYYFETPVIIDGRQVAKSTAKYTSEELAKLEKSKKRG